MSVKQPQDDPGQRKPVLTGRFWRDRLDWARDRGELHRAVFECSADQWKAICEKHREILARHIKHTDRILDAGCGWGRLLDLLPEDWGSSVPAGYLGVDLSETFITLAEAKYPGWHFVISDLRELDWVLNISPRPYDWAVLVSIKPMILRELGEEFWAQVEKAVKKVSKRQLYLEYDSDDEGTVVE